jgi:UDP-N-acetylglucosamine 4,6-dehydratase/5-epimerase
MSQKLTYKNKTVTITGGTGSFGGTFVRKLLKTDVSEVRILSRDEKKQDDLRSELSDDRVRFYIGDVRDESAAQDAIRGSNYVFHAAALKQVPSCEFFPMESVKTNILGTNNVVNAAIDVGVERVVCLSTDKAVYPINAMGISKAMMEKVAIANSKKSERTVINVTRYGNVMASRGSVIPRFLAQIRSGSPLTITDWSMSRFMMTLEDAVELVEFAFTNGQQGDLFVMKAPAANLRTLSHAMCIMEDYDKNNVSEIGARHGEKLHEVLVSVEEMSKAKDLGKFFCIPRDERGLNYEKYIDHGSLNLKAGAHFSSDNAEQLNVERMISQLKRLDLDWKNA